MQLYQSIYGPVEAKSCGTAGVGNLTGSTMSRSDISRANSSLNITQRSERSTTRPDSVPSLNLQGIDQHFAVNRKDPNQAQAAGAPVASGFLNNLFGKKCVDVAKANA